MVSEIPKKIYKMLLGLIAFSLSLTSIFATLSTVAIFSPGNIPPPSVDEYSPGQYNVSISINNAGFYDIEDVNVTLQLVISNATLPPFALLTKNSFLGTYSAQTITSRGVSFSATDFNDPGITIDPAITHLNVTVTINLRYLFGLMDFTAEFVINNTMGVIL